ncbi:MAG TPA: hypothetical protein VII06_07585 [Chloroflexota bacterium]|jgi:hypothetical protein
MATVIRRRLVLDGDRSQDSGRPEHPARASAGHALWWRWMPWTTPCLRLGSGLRPQTRLELALTALYRCQRDWPVADLVERLAVAPAGGDDNTTLVTAAHRHIGRGAAWDAVRDWLERGILVEVDSRASGAAKASPGATPSHATPSQRSALPSSHLPTAS